MTTIAMVDAHLRRRAQEAVALLLHAPEGDLLETDHVRARAAAGQNARCGSVSNATTWTALAP